MYLPFVIRKPDGQGVRPAPGTLAAPRMYASVGMLQGNEPVEPGDQPAKGRTEREQLGSCLHLSVTS